MVFLGVSDEGAVANAGGYATALDDYVIAPVDGKAGHVVVLEVFLLVVAHHDQHVELGAVEGLHDLGDALLVLVEALLELLGGDFLGDAIYVGAGQQVFIVGHDAVGADEGRVVLVVLSAGCPRFGDHADLGAVGDA